MEMRKIAFENATVLAVLDDSDNVISAGLFNNKEDLDEASRMIGVLLGNLGIIGKPTSGCLPMPYKKFLFMLDTLAH